MKHYSQQLRGLKIQASDGNCGSVEDLFFDDQSWHIRYMVANIGNWRSCRSLLIPQNHLLPPNLETSRFPVKLTAAQIASCPPRETDKPVYLQQEERLFGHYKPDDIDPQSSSEKDQTSSSMPNYTPDPTSCDKPIATANHPENRQWDRHLRSINHIRGYKVQASDGVIGCLKDFILDINSWRICFLAVDIGKWYHPKIILITPQHVRKIRWSFSKIFLSDSKLLIRSNLKYNSLSILRMN